MVIVLMNYQHPDVVCMVCTEQYWKMMVHQGDLYLGEDGVVHSRLEGIPKYRYIEEHLYTL